MCHIRHKNITTELAEQFTQAYFRKLLLLGSEDTIGHYSGGMSEGSKGDHTDVYIYTFLSFTANIHKTL